MVQEGIIKAGQKRNDREVIEERKIAADDEKYLESDKQDAGDMSRRSRSKRKPRQDQLNEMIPCGLKFVNPQWCKVKIATDRARYRLGFVVIGKAGQIAPARAPRSLIRPAPIMIRNPSQRKSQKTKNGGLHLGNGRPSSNGQRKMDKKPVSSS